MIQRTNKFRLYPRKEQEQQLQATLDGCRFVYNQLLECLNNQTKPNRLELQNKIPDIKKQHQWLKDIYSKTLQYESYRLFSNLRSLSQLKKNGRKVGRLRFKGKNWFKTFTYNQSGFKIINTETRLDKLHLSKIGEIPIKLHRQINGTIKQIVIKKYPSGKWYACICTDEKQSTAENRPIKKAVGLDLGIKYFLTDSDGRHIENPHNLKNGLKKLRREQCRLSKKKEQSNNRNKQRVKVAKIYEKIANQRLDFLHKLSINYVNNYDMIAIENLGIKGMVRNRSLSRCISDASWGRFANILSYKAENAGRVVVKVDPKGTSQEYNYGELDRDYNASLNILQRGLERLPQGLREITPVETEPLRELTLVPVSSVVESGSPLR